MYDSPTISEAFVWILLSELQNITSYPTIIDNKQVHNVDNVM